MLHEPGQKHMRRSYSVKQASPLWQRVPTRTATGEMVADFIMLIKQLNRASPIEQQTTLDDIHRVLSSYSDFILLVELNLNINLLWVSHVSRPNLGSEIAAAIFHVCPRARLISQRMS